MTGPLSRIRQSPFLQSPMGRKIAIALTIKVVVVVGVVVWLLAPTAPTDIASALAEKRAEGAPESSSEPGE